MSLMEVNSEYSRFEQSRSGDPVSLCNGVRLCNFVSHTKYIKRSQMGDVVLHRGGSCR